MQILASHENEHIMTESITWVNVDYKSWCDCIKALSVSSILVRYKYMQLGQGEMCGLLYKMVKLSTTMKDTVCFNIVFIFIQI